MMSFALLTNDAAMLMMLRYALMSRNESFSLAVEKTTILTAYLPNER